MTTANGNVTDRLLEMRAAHLAAHPHKPTPTLEEPLRQTVSTLSRSERSQSSTDDGLSVEESNRRHEERQRIARCRELWTAAKVPQRFRDPPENNSPEWEAARGTLFGMIGTGSLIGLLGTRGAGKTHMAACAIRHVCDTNRAALYTTAMDIFLTVKRSFRQSATETEAEAIGGFLWQPLLVIDEAHERGESDWEDRMLRYVIDKRYAATKDTIVIANLKPAELTKSLGASFADRMLDGGGIIDCSWPSFRGARP